MARKIITCIDTEMSCWEDREFQKRQLMEVYEFGMAQIDVEKLEVVRTGRYYVKNTRHDVTKFCTEFTGITQDHLSKQGLHLSHVAELLVKKWGVANKKNPILAWGDERRWMERDMLDKGVPYCFHNNLINLADFYRFGLSESGRTNSRISLKNACRDYGVGVVEPQHSAKADAETLALLVIEMIKVGHLWPRIQAY